MTRAEDRDEALANLHLALLDPRISLPTYGRVQGQFGSKIIPYDPDRITVSMHQDILDYIAEPPVMLDYIPEDIIEQEKDDDDEWEGYTRFFTVLAGRQVGKSTAVEYALYPKVAYTPGWDHTTIADTRSRAEYLHGRLQLLHKHWPEELRAETMSTNETRQLTFRHNNKARCLSEEDKNVGIGQSPDSFHASECGFWKDFAGVMFMINPSLRNRARCLAIFECTPSERDDDWHRHCLLAKQGEGRHFYKFYPFWDGVYNRRVWPSSWVETNEELDLLHKHSATGLTHEHLAFRRITMDDDEEIRRHPELFAVFYPFDDKTCWIGKTTKSIPDRALVKHVNRPLIDWDPKLFPSYQFQEARPGAVYIIGVDPSAGLGRDHGAFVVIEVWAGLWQLVFSYAGWADQPTFAAELIRVAQMYNNAKIVIERNGPGIGIITACQLLGYRHLMSDKEDVYGIHVSNTGVYALPKLLNHMIDALMDELNIPDGFLVEQLQTYRRDKELEENLKAEVLRGSAAKNRRPKHHWDSVSALQMAIQGCRTAPQREPPWAEKPAEPADFGAKTLWTHKEVDARIEQNRKLTYNAGGGKSRAGVKRVNRPGRRK